MASNEIEIEQSTTELKHLELLKKIVVRLAVLLSNAYDFAKENFSNIKSTAGSAENTVVSTEGQKLVELAQQIIVFVDDKFDEYASSSVKQLLAQFQSLVYKIEPLFNILLATTQTFAVPLITVTIFLLQITKYLIQNITTTSKSAPLVSNAETPLLQSSLDTTKSLVPDTILQTGPDLANQVADTTKSLAGGLPLVGDVAQSLVTNPTDVANQILDTTNSLVNNNPILEAVNSATQNSLDTTKSILQTGSDLANQAQDTAESLVGGIPLVGNVAQTLVTNPTDLTNQIANTANSLVNENPILGAVNSVVGDIPLVDNVASSLVTNPTDLANEIVNTTSSLVTENPVLEAVNSVAQSTLESPDIVNQALDTTKSVVEDIPLVGNVAQSVVTNPADLANKIVGTTDTLVNENPVVEAVSSVAQNSLDATKSLLSDNKALSAVGGLFGLNKK